MKKIVELHLVRLRRSRKAPQEQERLRRWLVAHLYPAGDATVRQVCQQRIPVDAPDWYFEAELRRSGLWEMMERCYPTPHCQSQ